MHLRLAAMLVLGLEVVLVASGAAQAGERRGVVRDAHSGVPVAGAIIVAGGEVVIADDDGGFVVDAAAGAVVVNAAGYAELTFALAGAAAGVDVDGIVITLEPSTEADEIIVIEGAAPDLGQAPARGLDADDLRSMPGAMGDALRAVQALPEVARVPFSLGGLAVRGMSPRDTDAYLDGVPIPQAFHAGGVAAVIPSASIDALELVPGAIDARYGGALGGVVLLHTREPRGDRYRMRGEVSPLDTQVGGEGPFAKGAIAVGIRRAHLADVVAPFLSEDTLVPGYRDGQIRWSREAGKTRYSLLALIASSELVLEEGTLGTETVRVAGRWSRSDGPWTSTALVYVGRDRLDIEAEEAIPPYDVRQLHTSDEVYGARGDIVRDASWGHAGAGVDAEWIVHRLRWLEMSDNLPWEYLSAAVKLGQVGAWAEHRWLLGDGRLAIKTGVRADVTFDGGHRSPIDLAPRILVTEIPHPRVRVRAALAQQRRPLGVGARAARVEDLDTWIKDDMPPPAPRPRAVQAQLGVDIELVDGLTVSPGVFAVAGDDVELPRTVVQTTVEGDPVISPFGAVARELMAEALPDADDDGLSIPYGRGRASGVDLMVRLDRGRWRGLLSYTYSTAERRQSLRYAVPSWDAYILDQPHNLSAALMVRLGRWRLGARYRFVSGGPMPYEGFLLPDRLPDYMDLSVRAERGWRRPWGEVHAFVDVQNATNRRNVEDIISERSGPKEIVGLPILPFAGLEYRPPP